MKYRSFFAVLHLSRSLPALAELLLPPSLVSSRFPPHAPTPEKQTPKSTQIPGLGTSKCQPVCFALQPIRPGTRWKSVCKVAGHTATHPFRSQNTCPSHGTAYREVVPRFQKSIPPLLRPPAAAESASRRSAAGRALTIKLARRRRYLASTAASRTSAALAPPGTTCRRSASLNSLSNQPTQPLKMRAVGRHTSPLWTARRSAAAAQASAAAAVAPASRDSPAATARWRIPPGGGGGGGGPASRWAAHSGAWAVRQAPPAWGGVYPAPPAPPAAPAAPPPPPPPLAPPAARQAGGAREEPKAGPSSWPAARPDTCQLPAAVGVIHRDGSCEPWLACTRSHGDRTGQHTPRRQPCAPRRATAAP